MRVLMLGWEYPPHISGGLGTACQGLSQGLVRAGVAVRFVVPVAYGDEEADGVEILGCNELEIDVDAGECAPGGSLRAAAAQAGETVAAEAAPAPEPIAFGAAPEFGAYLTEEDYARALEGSDLPAASPRARSFRRAAAAWEDVLAAAPAGIQPDWTRAVFRRAVKLEFSGRYGPDLLSEVARFAVAVGRIAERGGFDVIHAHDWMTYPAGLVAARVSKKPLVVHMHATEYDRSGENVNERIREIECLGLFGADLVVAVSHYTAGVLAKRYGVPRAKIRVVHNAVTHREQRALVRWRKTVSEPIVLFLGRVTFQKGPDYFLEAAARVVAVEPRVKFVMAGSGDMLPPMIERAARLGLARHVHFTGFLRGLDVERMYAMADIYVMPSVSEPFGISPLEAMALDVPVLVSRQSGVAEVLRNALKADFWDVDDIANKILALLRREPLRRQLVEEGREEIRRIRWDTPARIVRGIYEELVG